MAVLMTAHRVVLSVSEVVYDYVGDEEAGRVRIPLQQRVAATTVRKPHERSSALSL